MRKCKKNSYIKTESVLNMKKVISIFENQRIYFIAALILIITITNSYSQNQSAKSNTTITTLQDKNDILEVRNFISQLNNALKQYNIQITLSQEKEKLLIQGVGRMDSWGKKEAIQLIVSLVTTGKVTSKSYIQKTVPAQDRNEIIGFVLDAIEMAYDSNGAKLENISANTDLYTEYENVLSEVTDTYKNDWLIETERLNRSIAQTEQIIAQKEQNIAQTEQIIAQKEQNIAQNCKEAEAGLLKIYKLNPNDEKLKSFAKEGKKMWDEQGYKYSEETAKMFEALGIK